MKDRIPVTPPVILPLSSDEERPLFSVMIPVYNCITFLQATIESVLAQDWGIEKPQIEVIDDCSTDGDVESLVKRVGSGNVSYFRKKQNEGNVRNFETCINRAKGRLVHILHGDDIVKPGFYKEIANLFSVYPDIGAAITRHVVINEEGDEQFESINIQPSPGIIKDWLIRIAQQQLINTPAIVVKRSVYETIGSFYGVEYCEDWIMWAKIAANFDVAYTPTVGAGYRIRANNVTSKAFASGQNIKDVKKAIDIIQGFLPADRRRQVKKRAGHYFSAYFTIMAYKALKRNSDPKLALRQVRGALALQTNLTTLAGFLRIYTRYLISRIKGGNQ